MADQIPGIRIIPIICPSCGMRIEASSNEAVFWCIPCRAPFRISRHGGIEAVTVFHATGSGDHHLPFWTMDFSLTSSDITIDSAESFAAATGIITKGSCGTSSSPLLFVPAFPMPAAQRVKVGRQMTLRMPILAQAKDPPRTVSPIVTAEEDARTIAETVVLDALPSGRRDSLPFLKTHQVVIGTVRLATVPFMRDGNGYINEDLSLAFR